MKNQNLLATISLAIFIFTNSLSEIISLSSTFIAVLNIVAGVLGVIALTLQLKKKNIQKYAI